MLFRFVSHFLLGLRMRAAVVGSGPPGSSVAQRSAVFANPAHEADFSHGVSLSSSCQQPAALRNSRHMGCSSKGLFQLKIPRAKQR